MKPGDFIRVRVTQPRIVIARDRRVRDAVAFLPCRVFKGLYVKARILRVHKCSSIGTSGR